MIECINTAIISNQKTSDIKKKNIRKTRGKKSTKSNQVLSIMGMVMVAIQLVVSAICMVFLHCLGLIPMAYQLLIGFILVLSVLITLVLQRWKLVGIGGGYILGNYNGAIKGFIHLFAPAGGTVIDFKASNGLHLYRDEYEGLEVGYSLGVMVYPDSNITITYKVTTAQGVTTPLGVSSTPTLQGYR